MTLRRFVALVLSLSVVLLSSGIPVLAQEQEDFPKASVYADAAPLAFSGANDSNAEAWPDPASGSVELKTKEGGSGVVVSFGDTGSSDYIFEATYTITHLETNIPLIRHGVRSSDSGYIFLSCAPSVGRCGYWVNPKSNGQFTGPPQRLGEGFGAPLNGTGEANKIVTEVSGNLIKTTINDQEVPSLTFTGFESGGVVVGFDAGQGNKPIGRNVIKVDNARISPLLS